MKNIIKLNESQLKKIIAKSVMKALNESMDGDYEDLRGELMNLGTIGINVGGKLQKLDSGIGEEYGINEDAVDEILENENRIKKANRSFDEILDFDGRKVVLRLDTFNIVYVSGWCYIEDAPDRLFPSDEVENWDSDMRRKARRVLCVFNRKEILKYLEGVE